MQKITINHSAYFPIIMETVENDKKVSIQTSPVIS